MIETTSEPNHSLTPFAGRHVLYSRLQQHVLDPLDGHAILFTGHQGMGKTAMLSHAQEIFSDPILAVYTPLSDPIYKDKTQLLQALVNGINQLLEANQFSLSRIPQLEPEPELDFSAWLSETYLPEIFTIIRSHRHIVWLLDDAENLLQYDDDFLAYLHNILKAQPQFMIAGTLSTEHEDKLHALQPLIDPVKAERIHRLNYDDSLDLIRQYASGANEDIAADIFTATSGHPQLLTYYGEALQKHWADHTDSSAFSLAKPEVYAQSQVGFRQIWLTLSRDERLVLTAIASLIYDDPLQIVSPKRIEQWLIETDYQLDIVAINAALRSLDYQDIVSQQQSEGVRITMGLLQHWLLEKARLDDTVDIKRGQLPVWVIALVILFIIAIIILVITIQPQYLDNSSIIPTATLAS